MQNIAIIAVISYFFISGLAIAAMGISELFAAEPPMPTEATIACPFGGTMSFVRGLDATLTVRCTDAIEEPKVETHAASTKPYILND